MIDSHCHLDFSAFDGNRESLLHDCAKIGFTRLLIPAITLAGMPNLLKIQASVAQTAKLPLHIDLAFGLHPYFLNSETELQLPQLADYIEQHQQHILAIGETGLDGAIADKVEWDLQERIFISQIEIAKAFELPLIVHHRQSHNELIRLLKQQKFNNGGIIHGFSGSEQVARQYIDLGFLLGIGGTITYGRARKTRKALQALPLDSFVLETDAPDMPMQGRQGKPNSPLYLPDVIRHLSDLLSLSPQEVITQTTHNYVSFFKLGA
ncbi:TatD family hydrolase [Alteromonas sp. a30]|uniref:TatD family hydrolase n=1 Tax=Alteromonas sp. a30 TaxID=2730917 RepID=UPI0022827F76|nr:TatD family hydrolase [Alteromonas sp. a30]